MKTALVELISKISAGVMSEDEVARIADEAAQAYADPAAFLAANPDINYDDSFPIPLGEWVVVGSLPDTVLFNAVRSSVLASCLGLRLNATPGPNDATICASTGAKVLWILLILLLPVLGLIIWAIAGPRGNVRI
jgi:hypothetical protein